MAVVIDKTLEIDARAAVVWDVIADPARYPESSLRPGDPIDRQRERMSQGIRCRAEALWAQRLRTAA
jgi:hypothetical protein